MVRSLVRRAWPAALTLMLVAGAAGHVHATPWAKFAPDPLPSDSAYAALSAMPHESLGVAQRAWLRVERDWRAQRQGEREGKGSRSLTSTAETHHARPDDARFADLASRPFAALDPSEREWLVKESAAQRNDRNGHALTSALVVAGAFAGAVLVGIAIFESGAWDAPTLSR